MPYNNGYNPYQQPYNYFNQRPSIPGKTITNPNEILPQDVPMDGSVGLFPVQDHSCIYAKAWNSNGTIATVKYVPEQTIAQPAPTPAISLETVSNKLDRIEKMLKQRRGNKSYHKHSNDEEENNESTVAD